MLDDRHSQLAPPDQVFDSPTRLASSVSHRHTHLQQLLTGVASVAYAQNTLLDPATRLSNSNGRPFRPLRLDTRPLAEA